MKDAHFLALMAIVGLAAGIAAFQLIPRSPNGAAYCDQVEQDIRSNQSFNGTVACYPPGVLNVDLNESGDVANKTELKCVCRRSFNGKEQIFAIRKAVNHGTSSR